MPNGESQNLAPNTTGKVLSK